MPGPDAIENLLSLRALPLAQPHTGSAAVLVGELDADSLLRLAIRVPWRSSCPRLPHFYERLRRNAQALMQSPDHFERQRAPSI